MKNNKPFVCLEWFKRNVFDRLCHFQPKPIAPEIAPEIEIPLSSSIARVFVDDLIKELGRLEGVEAVRVIADSPGDLHSLVFEMKAPSVDLIEAMVGEDSLWDQAETLALQFHRKLRRATNEKWYFHTELVQEFGEERGDAYGGSLRDHRTGKERGCSDRGYLSDWAE